MRTIFITIFQGAEARNILRTDIYKNLIAREDVRIVFFVDSSERAEYYQKEFSHSRVFYEVVENKMPKGLDRIFSQLSFPLLRTATTDLRRKMALEERRNYLGYYIMKAVNFILARRWIRKIMRTLDYAFVKNRTFSRYFDHYNPDVVLLAHLFDGEEINLLREAKRRNVRSIGFINSWDKLTARRALRLLPDSLIVFNGIVKQEAIEYADMDERNIFVSGIPQYDWHVNYQPISRENFCQKNKLDPQKKIIVYAPMGKAFSNSDWDIIDMLRIGLADGSVKNAQLFVRFQPNDFVEEAELKLRSDLRYEVPGVRFSRERGVNWDMTFDDIRGLTDMLANADLFVCYASSMSVDAAVFDKPVININFEVKGKEVMSKSPTFFYKTYHYGNVVKSGAVRFPKTKDELVLWINKYLEDPAIDRRERKEMVLAQCGIMDGRAGERIALYILTAN